MKKTLKILIMVTIVLSGLIISYVSDIRTGLLIALMFLAVYFIVRLILSIFGDKIEYIKNRFFLKIIVLIFLMVLLYVIITIPIALVMNSTW